MADLPSKTDLRGLNKDALLEQAFEMREQLEAASAAQAELEDVKQNAEGSEDLQELKNMVFRLTSALAGAQADLLKATQPEDAEVFEVKRVGGSAVSIRVTDEYGRDKLVFWQSRGAVKRLTKKQILEIMEKSSLFEDGVLSCPDVTPDSVNTLHDYDTFISSLSQDEVPEKIRAISSLGVLQSLYNHIENKRFRTVDERGKDFTDDEGLPVVQEVDLPSQYMLVEREVTKRIAEMQNVRASTEDVG